MKTKYLFLIGIAIILSACGSSSSNQSYTDDYEEACDTMAMQGLTDDCYPLITEDDEQALIEAGFLSRDEWEEQNGTDISYEEYIWKELNSSDDYEADEGDEYVETPAVTNPVPVAPVSGPVMVAPPASVVSEPSYDSPDLHPTCHCCFGTGECQVCHGTGQIKRYGSVSEGMPEIYETHSLCNGTGKCSACNGSGHI